jgi:hypothetical protein
MTCVCSTVPVFFPCETIRILAGGYRGANRTADAIGSQNAFLWRCALRVPNLAFAACKKSSRLADRAGQEVAEATPAPSATPVPEPINLKSEGRTEIRRINSLRCATQEWTLRASLFPMAR